MEIPVIILLIIFVIFVAIILYILSDKINGVDIQEFSAVIRPTVLPDTFISGTDLTVRDIDSYKKSSCKVLEEDIAKAKKEKIIQLHLYDIKGNFKDYSMEGEITFNSIVFHEQKPYMPSEFKNDKTTFVPIDHAIFYLDDKFIRYGGKYTVFMDTFAIKFDPIKKVFIMDIDKAAKDHVENEDRFMIDNIRVFYKDRFYGIVINYL